VEVWRSYRQGAAEVWGAGGMEVGHPYDGERHMPIGATPVGKTERTLIP